MMRCIILLCALCFGFKVHSQHYFSRLIMKEQPYLGFILSSVELPDSTIFLANTTGSTNVNAGKITVNRISVEGDSIFGKEYGLENSWYEQYKVIRIDSSIYMVGMEYTNGNDTAYAYLMKFTIKGDSLWKKNFNHGAWGSNLFSSIVHTSDGNLLLAGIRANVENPLDPGWLRGDRQGYVVKTDTSGNEIWHVIFGDNKHDETIYDIVEMPGQKYAVVGKTLDFIAWDFDAFFYIIDNNGNIVKKQQFSIPKYDVIFASIHRTRDNNFVVTGQYAENENYFGIQQKDGTVIALFDSLGNRIWMKTYLNNANEIIAFDITETPGGNFIVAGTAPNFKANVMMFSADGSFLWSNRINHNKDDERFTSVLYSIMPTIDGMYLVSGCASYLPDTLTGVVRCMPWVAKIDSNGCLVQNCTGHHISTYDPLSFDAQRLSIFPNPFSGVFSIALPPDLATARVLTVILTDITGHKVYQEKAEFSNTALQIAPGDALPPGVYVVQVSDGQRIYVGKVVKM